MIEAEEGRIMFFREVLQFEVMVFGAHKYFLRYVQRQGEAGS